MSADDQGLLPSSGGASVARQSSVEASHHLGVRLPAVVTDPSDVSARLVAVVVGPAVRPAHLPKVRLNDYLPATGHLLQGLQRLGLVAGDVVARFRYGAGQGTRSRSSLLVQLPVLGRNVGQYGGHGVAYENQASSRIEHEREVSQPGAAQAAITSSISWDRSVKHLPGPDTPVTYSPVRIFPTSSRAA